MRQQFKVLSGKLKRPGQRLQDVALFDEAGDPLALGGSLVFGEEINREEESSNIEIIPNDLTKATSVTAKFGLGTGVVSVGSWNRNIVQQIQQSSGNNTYLTILLPPGESYYVSNNMVGLWETPIS